ncbi:MAG TPA: glycosyl hydrolase [Solirubrobacterales bacterium]|nr:glycosyl hydrolase [Solirubrobacterales bacterium]
MKRSTLLILALALTALVAPTGAQAALPADFWGVVANESPQPEEAATLRAGGVESIRVPVNWGAVQSGPGDVPDWGSVDPFVRAGAESGISVLPFLVGAPGWVVHSEGVGDGTRAPVSLPVQSSAERAAWREFLRRAVVRYGPGGSFWAENPLLPAHPIRTWQIWNEENFKYFAARPSPSQYGKLVVNSYRDLRSADPGARIVLGGLFGRPKGGDTKAASGRIKRSYFAADFLEQMYKTTPGVRGKFLAVALHPYSYTYKQLAPEIEELRAALKASRDGGRAIWLTELGWSSGHPSGANGRNKFEKGRSGQARELRGAFGLLRSHAAAWRVKRVYWFSFTDSPGTCNFCDGSGLFGEGMRPKPAWSSYRGFAR